MGAKRVIPGFGLSFGITASYLSFMVLLPLSMIFLRLTEGSTEQGWLVSVWKAVSSSRAIAAYQLSFGASFLAKH